MTARSRKPDSRWLSDLPASSASSLNRRISVSKGGTEALNSLQPGMASERTRQRMVERLQQQGIRDAKVLAAMLTVPRHLFVDEALASRAYEDTALPIAHAQTISQPYIVARMIELALPAAGAPAGKVLEIGTGCGYQAAVLARVFTEVYTVERIRVLHQAARSNLRPLRVPNIRLVHGDGMLGLPQAAPFDAIVVAAAGLELPPALLQQLRIGGKLIAPVGDQEQHLLLVERTSEQRWQQTRLDAVRFVPLLAGTL